MEEEYLDATIQMPEQASTLAPMVDSLYYDIFWISVVFFVAIVGAMVWFAVQFRRRPGVTSKPPGHHNALELFWTFSPLILLAYMFHEGFLGFMHMSVPPADSINVRVHAKQWHWEFEYPNGATEAELWVPEHQPVRLIMGSQDVLHSFFVPALRVKRDIVPGMYTSLWFEPTRRGVHDIFCTEYCGANPANDALSAEALNVNGRPQESAGHSGMLSRLHIVSRAEWNEHVNDLIAKPEDLTWPQWGEQLFGSSGCPACHVVQPGAAHTTGPNLANVVGYPQPLEGGGEAAADIEYMRRSLREPQADIVRTFTTASMPAQTMHEVQLDAIVAYLASISDRGQPVVQQVETLHAE
jgi:cytochrome c oxidase subunit 2